MHTRSFGLLCMWLATAYDSHNRQTNEFDKIVSWNLLKVRDVIAFAIRVWPDLQLHILRVLGIYHLYAWPQLDVVLVDTI